MKKNAINLKKIVEVENNEDISDTLGDDDNNDKQKSFRNEDKPMGNSKDKKQ